MQTLILSIVIFIGMVLLAWGYYGAHATLMYTGLIVTLVGVVPQMFFTIIGERVKRTPRRNQA